MHLFEFPDQIPGQMAMGTDPIRQHAKLRVVNEQTGREWIGYAIRDLTDERISLWIPETNQRVTLSGPEYRVESV